MATVASTKSRTYRPSQEIPQNRALRTAWRAYGLMLLIPLFLSMYVIWELMEAQEVAASQELAQQWFIATMVYLMLAVPAAIFWRSHMFLDYWRGRPVAPRDYLIGMLTVWIALEIGGILAILGMAASGKIMPLAFPALFAFLFFLPLWPKGKAMVRPVGHTDDPGTYEEPR